MAATVQIHAFHGAGPFSSPTDLGDDITNTTIRFKRADNDSLDANNPIPIPASGKNFSFRKSFKIAIIVAPDFRIENLRFFQDGAALGADRRILFNQVSSYTQGTTADETAAISAVDVETKTVASPQVVQAGTVFLTGTDTAPGTGGAQDFVELQFEVGPVADVGSSQNAKLFTMRFDEI